MGLRTRHLPGTAENEATSAEVLVIAVMVQHVKPLPLQLYIQTDILK